MSYIYTKHLKKSFKKGRNIINVLNDVSLNISSPGLYFILGESGEGKTTLGNILLGYEKSSEGTIKISFKKKPYGIIIFQDYQLFNELTIYENLLPFGDEKEIDNYLKEFGLESRKDSYPNTLSGGETQRVSLIRALLSNVPLIIADEPTSALDMIQTNKVMSELYQASLKRIVIVITHNIMITSLYPSTIYRLEQGILTKETSNKNNEEKKIEEKKFHFRYGLKTISKICFKNFTKSYKRFIYSFFAFLISISLGICGLSFMISLPKTINKISQNYITENIYEVSEVKSLTSDSKLNLNQYLRPNSLIKSKLIEQEFILFPSLGYLMNVSSVFYPRDSLYALAQDNLIPVIDESIKEKEVVVNDLFMDKHECKIGDKIRFFMNLDLEYVVNDNSVSDTLTIDEEWTISKVCNETSFLNVSTIFYPLDFLIDELDAIEVKNLSYEMKNRISWKDRITVLASDDEDISDNKIIVQSPYALEETINRFKKIDDISFTSRSIITKNTFDEIYDSIKKLIIIFVISLFFISLISLVLNINEGIYENRSSFAIISSFRINSLYAVIISSYQIFISLILSMFCVPLFSIMINKIINIVLSNINVFLCFDIPFSTYLSNGFSSLFTLEVLLIIFHLLSLVVSLYLQNRCAINSLLKESK